jgi:signal peptidase I
MKNFIQIVKNKLWWVPIAFIGREYVTVSAISGRSMSPTLNPHTDKERDIVLIWKTDNVQVNELCFFLNPFDAGMSLVKRVTGLEGDWMFYRNRHATVPTGHVWVQADESFRGMDSRDFGPLPRGLIWGKAIAIIYPLNRIRWL